jgi:DNA replication protein DnaC
VYTCSTCEDKQIIFDPVRNVARQCKCVETRRIQRIFRHSEISSEFQKIRLYTYLTEGKHPLVKRAKHCAEHYLDSFHEIRKQKNNFLVFLGDSGAGKTHLICSVANVLMENQTTCLYFPYVEGFKKLKRDLNSLEEKVHLMRTVDVLLLDDLFKKKKGKGPTDFEFDVMFDVINDRYLAHRPTLISSELDRDGLIDIDEALASRIIERSKGHTVTFRLTSQERAQGITLNYRLVG